MQGIGPTDREGMRKFSLNIRSPEVIWDRVNAFTATARVRSENRCLVKRVVISISCVIDFGLWFFGVWVAVHDPMEGVWSMPVTGHRLLNRRVKP